MNIWSKETLYQSLWNYNIDFIEDEDINRNRLIISNVESFKLTEYGHYELKTHDAGRCGYSVIRISEHFIAPDQFKLKGYTLILNLRTN